MFYIFMVWNKSLTVHTIIYDMAHNILYEDKDVTVKILGDENMDSFLEDANEKVQKRNYHKKYKVDKKEQVEFDYDNLYDPYDLARRRWRC